MRQHAQISFYSFGSLGLIPVFSFLSAVSWTCNTKRNFWRGRHGTILLFYKGLVFFRTHHGPVMKINFIVGKDTSGRSNADVSLRDRNLSRRDFCHWLHQRDWRRFKTSYLATRFVADAVCESSDHRAFYMRKSIRWVCFEKNPHWRLPQVSLSKRSIVLEYPCWCDIIRSGTLPKATLCVLQEQRRWCRQMVFLCSKSEKLLRQARELSKNDLSFSEGR